MPQRFDRSELKKPTRTREGWLRADGYLTRTGVFEYRLGNGKVQRELRLPEEVFHDDALASFISAPLTREHPTGAVTAENWRNVAVGNVGENVKRDGDFVRATLFFNDAATIAELERRDRTELSCGYTCDLEDKPGEHEGQRYDCIQRNIRGNHVALVSRGRAGPQVRVRLDAADALDSSLSEAPDEKRSSGGDPVVKFRIDGVEYEVSEQAAQAIGKMERTRADADVKQAEELKAAKSEAEKVRGRADELEKKLGEAEKARKDAESPERIAAQVRALVALHASVTPHLDKDTVSKLDGMSEREVKLALLKKLGADIKSDASDDYVQGRFEAAIEGAKKRTPSQLQAVRGATQSTTTTDSSDEDPVAAARKKMLDDARDAWKPKQKSA